MKVHLQNPAADKRDVECASMVDLINIFEIHIVYLSSIEVVFIFQTQRNNVLRVVLTFLHVPLMESTHLCW